MKDSFINIIHPMKIEEKETFVYKIRSFIYRKFKIWDIFDFFPYTWRLYYYEYIQPIIKPKNKRLRKFVPKKYTDICSLIVDTNFELIKIFYEEEYLRSSVDWNFDKKHKNFAKWLENAYEYITVERKKLEIDLENAYPPFDIKNWKESFEETELEGKKMYRMKKDDIPYSVEYAEVNRLESLIQKEDTKILVEMVKKRDFFWT